MEDKGAKICTVRVVPRYIIDLVKRITTVSVETVSIVKTLPPLEEG